MNGKNSKTLSIHAIADRSSREVVHPLNSREIEAKSQRDGRALL